MKPFLTALILGLGTLATVAVPKAKADPWDQKTEITFSEPVRVADYVLEPGHYVFKLADTETNSDLVAIYSADETHAIGFVLAVPASRPNPGDVSISLSEQPVGSPRAIHAWFFAGDTSGVEFPAPSVLHH